MILAQYFKYKLKFKRPAGTSRGVLKTKLTYFIVLNQEGKMGYGECNLFEGLSIDDRPDYENQLAWTCENIGLGKIELLKANREFPSIQFGLEQAFLSFESMNNFELFKNSFSRNEIGISINGLIWMGDEGFMREQVAEKLEAGFDTIKMKIGAIDFETELKVLKSIRSFYDSDNITLRVDANGAFTPQEAEDKLKALAEYDLHSIEQPIKQGNLEAMSSLCKTTPVPIALDEELIGVFDSVDKKNLLKRIMPQYIILKPALVGGFIGAQQWMSFADELSIPYWITSALESNIGLNAISQWTASLKLSGAQGLGTGSLFTNNITSPLEVKDGKIYYRQNLKWDLHNTFF